MHTVSSTKLKSLRQALWHITYKPYAAFSGLQDAKWYYLQLLTVSKPVTEARNKMQEDGVCDIKTCNKFLLSSAFLPGLFQAVL